jgi:amino acid transporter
MPPRSPETIPQPEPKQSAPPSAAPAPARKRGTLEVVGIVVLTVITVVCGISGILGTLGVATDSTSGAGEYAVIGAGWAITAAIVFALILLVRRGKK